MTQTIYAIIDLIEQFFTDKETKDRETHKRTVKQTHIELEKKGRDGSKKKAHLRYEDENINYNYNLLKQNNHLSSMFVKTFSRCR